ncbi:hypothetical protein D3C72_2262690 [compost metagenome]
MSCSLNAATSTVAGSLAWVATTGTDSTAGAGWAMAGVMASLIAGAMAGAKAGVMAEEDPV